MQRDRPQRPCLQDLAKQWVKIRWRKPGRVYLAVVHRLDAPVAGVALLARTSKAAGRLSRQIREQTVRKTYRAVAEGRLPDTEGVAEHYLLRRDRNSQVVPSGTTGSQLARLRYRCLDQTDNRSLLEIELETGRRHQIRLQLAAMGCPIAGDRRYGARQSLTHGRIALLSYRLGVDHPTSGQRLFFQCPMPAGWPWPGSTSSDSPLWTVEDLMAAGWRPAVLDAALR